MSSGKGGLLACSSGSSRPDAAVIGLARGRTLRPRIASKYPRWAVEFGILGPLEVRCGSDVVPIRRGLPRTILVALVMRHGRTVPSDFLVDVLWGEDLPRNPANALQIQVSYLRK